MNKLSLKFINEKVTIINIIISYLHIIYSIITVNKI
jgi:hypothetical protein